MSRVTRTRLIGALMVAALVSACAASAQNVGYGGTLVVGVTQDPGSLDPTMTATSTAVEILQAMCLPLYRFAKNHGRLEYEPVLAASLPTISTGQAELHGPAPAGGPVQRRHAAERSTRSSRPINRFMTFPGSTRASDLPTSPASRRQARTRSCTT